MVLTTPEAIIEQASTTKLLDDLIDESVRTSARRPIIMQFDPSSGWIWKRWKGTVFSETWDSCVYKMVYASLVYLACKSFPQVKDTLSGFSILWGQLLSVTTFTLTFFVNQSYALWRKCTELSRRLQGRLHDLDMTLAAHAARKPAASPNEPSTYTPAARQILELVSRYVRLFNLLTYASFTRSHRPILTPRGMRRLVERGLMTPMERQILVDAEIPATQRHNAVLLWILRACVEGKEAGHFLGGAGFEQNFMEKAHVARASYGGIGDELQGRMPLAYAHIVQVLVDLVLWLYPFMAYSAGMSGLLCVLGTGLLTMSYQGLVRFYSELKHFVFQVFNCDVPPFFNLT
jgi:Bestrophin, RFP-TM, chloride channel